MTQLQITEPRVASELLHASNLIDSARRIVEPHASLVDGLKFHVWSLSNDANGLRAVARNVESHDKEAART